MRNAFNGFGLTVVVALLVIACVIGVVNGRRPQEERFTTQLSTTGVALLDGRCRVQPSDSPGPVYLSSFDGLQRSPELPDGTCVLVPGAGDGLLDEGLKGCARGSAVDVDPSVVSGIGVRTVDGTETCVVTLVPGLPASRYQKYSAALLDAATMRSELYIGAVNALSHEGAILEGIQACNAATTQAQSDYGAAVASLASDSKRAQVATALAAKKKKEADVAAQEVARLQGLLAGCEHVRPDHALKAHPGNGIDMAADGSFTGVAQGVLDVNLPEYLISPALQSVTAADGTVKGVSYALAQGSLPQGATLSSRGVLHVSPSF